MERSIEICLLQESDIEVANSFHNTLLNTNRTNEQFIWEFINSPHGEAIYILAKDTSKNGKIIGTQSAIPFYMKTGNGKQILTAKTEDSFLDPNYRGSNIFDHMNNRLFEECKTRGISFLWALTFAVKPYAKIGFDAPFHNQQGIYCIDQYKSFSYLRSLNQKNKLLDHIKIYALTVAAKLLSMKLNFISSDLKTFEINNRESAELDSFFVEVLKEEEEIFHIQQDEQFLNWRIVENPHNNNYVQYALVNSKEELSGHVLCNINDRGFAFITQMVFLPSISVNIKRAFIKRIISNLKRKQMFMIRFWGYDTNRINREEIDLLKSMGFTFVDRGIPVVWMGLEGNNQLDAQKMFMSRMHSHGTS